MFSDLHEQDYLLYGLDPNFGSFVATYDFPLASVRTSDAAAVARKYSLELTYSSCIIGCTCVEIQKCHTGTKIKNTQILLCCSLFYFLTESKNNIYIYIYI